MENNITAIKKGTFNGLSKKEVALKLVKLFALLNPAIYKSFTVEELKDNIMATEIMISNIDAETLAEMIEMAIANYPQKRKENKKLVFDINYIIDFYKDAFDYVYCDKFKMELGATKLSSVYDANTGIIEQKWVAKTGEVVNIKCFAKLSPESKRPYSKKDEEQMWTDLDALKI